MEDIKKYLYHEKTEEPEGLIIKGYDFNEGVDYKKLVESFSTTGFQASHLSKAIGIVNKMISEKATIYLGYTSNLVTSGVRDIIRYLAENKKVDYLVTTGGGVEDDIIKCLGNFVLGDFKADSKELVEKGINRTGNIYVPDSRYVEFEKFLIPLLEEMFKEQKETGKVISPSEFVWKLGEKINDEKSICYWAWKNKIPVFCQTLTDGSIGDIIYVFSHREEEFKIDIVSDAKKLNDSTVGLEKSGVIVLGAGVVKHSILNANMFRNGADYAVYINTAQEFDGSDAGAEPAEAVTWGKIRQDGEMVKVFGDATILFPLLVAGSFAKDE